MVASLFISGRDWILPVSLLLGLGFIALIWSYARAPAAGGVRLACASLKAFGIVLLGLCLLEPLWTDTRARPGSNLFVILADNSQGMTIKDPGEPQSRGEQLRSILANEEAVWRKSLHENFQVRKYYFDSRLGFTKDFRELNFEGRSSSLHYALKALARRYEGQPLAGILLFSDGNATDSAGSVSELKGLPPIYPYVMGKQEALKDIALRKVSASQTAFEDAPVTIQAEVSAQGYAGRQIVAQLVEITVPGGSNAPAMYPSDQQSGQTEEQNSGPVERVVEEQVQRAPVDGSPLAFRFQTRPSKAGVVFYRVRLSAKGEERAVTDSEQTGEATLANNSRVVVVDRGQGPYRILYLGGRPNWEFKFLNRALMEDLQVELISLIRIAKREPKFEFKGRAGESSNPLYRGFDRQDEDTERYDQPVLVRMTRDSLQARAELPKTAEELFSYHAVIVDDLEASFFTSEQMSMLQRFVSERGGGFLMLGGIDTFQHGEYARTPVGDLLPVYLDRKPSSRAPTDLRLNLTREGWLQPWVRLRSNEVEERARLQEMPDLDILNETHDIKPGASVLATVSDSEGETYPALVVHRFGRGRSAALLLGALWRWGMQDASMQADLAKAWRQTARWLVADVPNRVELEVEPDPSSPEQAVVLKTRVRDKLFLPFDNAGIELTVYPLTQPSTGEPASDLGGHGIRLQAEPALEEAGLYQSTFIPRETGGYLASVVVKDDEGMEIGREEAGWASDSAAEEFESLTPNRALLESLAKQTEGEMVTDLESFVQSLPNRKVPITETWSFPLWHTPWVFLLALGCFVAEWGLRRWKGLA